MPNTALSQVYGEYENIEIPQSDTFIRSFKIFSRLNDNVFCNAMFGKVPQTEDRERVGKLVGGKSSEISRPFSKNSDDFKWNPA